MADGELSSGAVTADAANAVPNERPVPLLRFENVTKRFGDFAAVEHLSLDIFPGEFFALLGPSGCGKSTLLRLVAGLEAADEGRIVLDGVDLGQLPPHLRPVNMMFQNYALFPHMTVWRNIAFGLRQDGLARPAIEARVAEMLALVRLDGLGGRKPHQLSGGQRQRVALARALAKRPKILLLDEPMAALDKKLREETQGELAALHRRLDTTFVIVTHDQEEAMTLADRMAVMDRGRIMQVGTPAEIYEQPNSRAVASFIGDINLIEGTVARVDAHGAQVDCGAIGFFRAAPAGEHAAGARVVLALRPEKLRIVPEAPADAAANSAHGTVVDVNYLGEVSAYRVRVGEGLLLRAVMPNLTRSTEPRIKAGETVWLTWPADAGFLLGP